MDLVLDLPVAELDAATGGDTRPAGHFTAIVSTFDTVVPGIDVGRVLKRGCFHDSLARRGFPSLVWSHQWDTPPIGVTLAARETDEGLMVEGRLNLDSQLGREVHWAMTHANGDGRPAIREFSIGFDITDAAIETRDGEDVLAVSGAELYEFGPCLVGRNTTRLINIHGGSPDSTVLDRFTTDPSGSVNGLPGVAPAWLLAKPR